MSCAAGSPAGGALPGPGSEDPASLVGGVEDVRGSMKVQHRRYDRRRCGAVSSGRAGSSSRPVANRSRGAGRRSRKRRRAAAATATAGGLAAGAPDSGPAEASRGRKPKSERASGSSGTRARPRGAAQRAGGQASRGAGGFKDPQSVGERPRPPWHPLPLSEMLIVVGAVGAFVGLNKGASHGGPPLVAGLAAVVLGTAEFTLREHLSGYRSHTIILALLPTIALDTGAAFAIAAFVTPVPLAVKVAVLALDVPLVAFLFKLLRARFLDARRERVFAGGR
jgi:hypothetical protein